MKIFKNRWHILRYIKDFATHCNFPMDDWMIYLVKSITLQKTLMANFLVPSCLVLLFIGCHGREGDRFLDFTTSPLSEFLLTFEMKPYSCGFVYIRGKKSGGWKVAKGVVVGEGFNFALWNLVNQREIIALKCNGCFFDIDVNYFLLQFHLLLIFQKEKKKIEILIFEIFGFDG